MNRSREKPIGPPARSKAQANRDFCRDPRSSRRDRYAQPSLRCFHSLFAPRLARPQLIAVGCGCLLTGLWQVYILEGYLGSTLAIGHGWFRLALFGPAAALILGLAIVGWRKPWPGLPFAAGALSLLLAMPTAWSIGTRLVRGAVGFPTVRSPFPTAEAEARRGRWAQFVRAISGDPKLIAFLEHHHDREDYLLAAVNARQAAPIIVATGNPVMALGGFSGGDPILTVYDFARLVAEHRVRFALIGDGSEGIRGVFGEARQKPLTDWIQANGKRVDGAR